ncbi:hypothetical protein BH11GEM1_BH11GEM1_28870 [soil metagenome]
MFVFLIVGIVLEIPRDYNVKQHILSATLWDMPYLVWPAEALAYVGYFAFTASCGARILTQCRHPATRRPQRQTD